jgi:hypothetical protein
MMLDRLSFLGHRGNMFGFGHVKDEKDQLLSESTERGRLYLGVVRRVPTSVDRPRYFPTRA